MCVDSLEYRHAGPNQETTVIDVEESPAAAHATPWTRGLALRLLWCGWAASVPIVLLATIALEAMPHVRGIGFYPALRFAVLSVFCVLVAVAGAFLYGALGARHARARPALAAILLGLAIVLLFGLTVGGSAGLTLAAAPAVLSVAIALAFLIPRFVDSPRRSRVGTIALLLVGAIEIIGVVGAFSSERAAPPGAHGLPFEIPRAMFDVEHKFLDLPGGVRIHYVDEGNGPTLLFLHGNPSWSFQWRDLIRSLHGSYRCIALDYPGFGMSTAPAEFGYTPDEESVIVEEFINQLGLHDVTLVMQDWGGPIGLKFAERRPELVRGVILGSTWAWPTTKSEPRGIWSVIAGGAIGEFAQVNFNGVAAAGIKSSVVRVLPADVLEVYLRPFLPLDHRGIAAFYPEQITAASGYFAELEAGLPRLAGKKALIFWALQDPGFPTTDLAKFEKAFPNHQTIEFPNAKHFFFEDNADQMTSAIRAFMAPDSGGSAQYGGNRAMASKSPSS